MGSGKVASGRWPLASIRIRRCCLARTLGSAALCRLLLHAAQRNTGRAGSSLPAISVLCTVLATVVSRTVASRVCARLRVCILSAASCCTHVKFSASSCRLASPRLSTPWATRTDVLGTAVAVGNVYRAVAALCSLSPTGSPRQLRTGQSRADGRVDRGGSYLVVRSLVRSLLQSRPALHDQIGLASLPPSLPGQLWSALMPSTSLPGWPT